MTNASKWAVPTREKRPRDQFSMSRIILDLPSQTLPQELSYCQPLCLLTTAPDACIINVALHLTKSRSTYLHGMSLQQSAKVRENQIKTVGVVTVTYQKLF